jgi:2,3-bisphosphoglycerate-independent phosphoglycerate mutase
MGLGEVKVCRNDLVFRANLVKMRGARLISYNADFIMTECAIPLVNRIRMTLRHEFPEIELYHNCDFRNSLILRGAHVDPSLLICPEPHDHEGDVFDLTRLIRGKDSPSGGLASELNAYVVRVGEVLAGEATANMIFPWSASRSICLPAFREHVGFDGRTAIVGSMDFLQGIARSGGIEFFRVGNGRPDTDYVGKGAKVIELLEQEYAFVICHINAPDEAAHMHDRDLKIRCLEEIDRHIIGPVVRYFRLRMKELGGVMIVPDHYTNLLLDSARMEAHSLHPVPFALWNGRDLDDVTCFDEEAVRHGLYGEKPVNHCELLQILGIDGRSRNCRGRSRNCRPADAAGRPGKWAAG